MSVCEFPIQGCVNKVPGALLTEDGWHPSCRQGPVSGAASVVLLQKLMRPGYARDGQVELYLRS